MGRISNDGKKNKKGFFANIIEKLDKKLEEKSRKVSSCCKKNGDNKKEGGCC